MHEDVALFHAGPEDTALFHVSESVQDSNLTVHDDGTADLRGIPVFRAGTFRDSRNIKRKYTISDLDEMVANFSELRETFPRVPWRVDHGQSADDVVGHFTAVRRDGERLLADVHFSEPEAVGKYQRGTFFNRSAEVGVYRDNNDKIFNPVLRGCAWVDIPAIENLGMFRASDEENQSTEGEGQVPTIEELTADLETANKQIAELTASLDEATAPSDDKTEAKFRIAGADVAEFAAVQAHIDELEKFRTDTVESERTEFVDSLAADGKILESQKASFSAAVSPSVMSAEIFAEFKQGYEEAPTLGVFSGGQAQKGEEPPSTAPSMATFSAEPVSEEEATAMQERIDANLAMFRTAQPFEADPTKKG